MDRLIVESARAVGLFNEAAQGIMVVTAERYLTGHRLTDSARDILTAHLWGFKKGGLDCFSV